MKVPSVLIKGIRNERRAQNVVYLRFRHAGTKLIDHILRDFAPLLYRNFVYAWKESPTLTTSTARQQEGCRYQDWGQEIFHLGFHCFCESG